MPLQIRRLSYSLGAEILGIDISKVDDDTFSEIDAAFLEHSVLLFRGQPLTREQHVAFSRRFGEVEKKGTIIRNEAVAHNRDPAYPEILVHNPQPNAKATDYSGIDWHSDRAWSSIPDKASLLHSVEIPDVGGDTMFANMYFAYDALSDGMKTLLSNLHGLYPSAKNKIDDSTPERLAVTKRLSAPIAHPIVRVHPETGRQSLFFTERVKQFAGMTVEESQPLLQFLCKHATRPQFIYRHQWKKDDLLMWDNRCTLHIALMDYDKMQTRHMEKTAIRGTPLGYVYEGTLQ